MWKEREGGEGKEGRKVEEKAVGNGEECSQHPLISSLPWPLALHELVKQWTFINLPPPPPHRHVWETVSGRETTKAFKLPLFPGKWWGRFGSERQTDEKKKRTTNLSYENADSRWDSSVSHLRRPPEEMLLFCLPRVLHSFCHCLAVLSLSCPSGKGPEKCYILHAVLILWVPRVHWPLMSLEEAC